MENTHRQNNDELEDILREFSEPAPEADPAPEKKAPPPPKKKGKAGQKALFYGLLSIFAAIFLFSVVYLSHHLILQYRDEDSYDELGDIVASIQSNPTEAPTADDPSAPTIPTPEGPTEPVILPEYQPIYERNSDLVGWIKLEGTHINYPVMQTPDSPDYYLNRNFDKQTSKAGAIYVREACDVFKPSDNVVIYGHYISSGCSPTCTNTPKRAFGRPINTSPSIPSTSITPTRSSLCSKPALTPVGAIPTIGSTTLWTRRISTNSSPM